MAVFDSRVARALAAPARVEILRYLEHAGVARTVEEVAGVVGLHINTVRSHLDVLVDVGLVARDGERRAGPGRPRILYVASTVARELVAGAAGPFESGADEASVPLAGGYLELIEALTDELSEAIASPSDLGARAGRRWVEKLASAGWGDEVAAGADEPASDVASVVGLLERLGFSPRTEPLGDRIYLRSCPFEGRGGRAPSAFCSVHLGLLRAAFARLGGRVNVTGCDPLIRDGLCVVHLESPQAGTGSS